MLLNLPPSGSRVWILGRHSSEMQNPKSAEDQIREGRAYAERHGWTVVGTGKDEAKSGRSIVGRTAFYDAMAAAEAGECDVILVEDISRFARDAADTLTAARKLRENNVCICTVGGGVLSGLELVIRAQMAQEQSEEMGRRVKRGHRSAAIRGRSMGSVAYGYVILEGLDATGINREIDESKRPVVERIFKDFVAGLSSMDICRALNEEGVPAPNGGKWRPKTITGDPHLQNGIIRNPIYVGRQVYGKSRATYVASKGEREISAGLLMDQIITEAPQLRMIEDDLWMAAQEIAEERGRQLLNKQGEPVPNQARRPTYPLSGRIKCGVCGSTYAVAGDRLACDGRRLGTCDNSRRVSRKGVQSAVFDAVKHRLLSPYLIEPYLEEYRQEYAAASTQQADKTQSIETRRREVGRQVQNLLSIARMGASDDQAGALLHEELGRLGAEQKALDREAMRRPVPVTLPMETEAIIQRLEIMLNDLGDALEGDQRDAARARDILRTFIDRVVVTPLEAAGKADGRGCGPVRVTVEGSLAALLGVASIDRVVQRSDSPLPALDHAKWPFSVYVDLANSSLSERTFADIALVSRLLDDARTPLRKRDMIVAMEVRALGSPDQSGPDAFQRVSAALKYLRGDDLIRPIVVEPGYTGWVWNECLLDDEEWCQRVRDPAVVAGKLRRVVPPEAFVTVISDGR